MAADPGRQTRAPQLPRGIRAFLGIDIVFAERDRLSPPEIVRELPDLPASLVEGLAQLPPSERELAEAMRAVPTVLALVPSRENTTPSSDPLHPAPIRQAGGDPTPFLMNYKSLLRSLPELASATQGAGAIAAEPDEDWHCAARRSRGES